MGGDGEPQLFSHTIVLVYDVNTVATQEYKWFELRDAF